MAMFAKSGKHCHSCHMTEKEPAAAGRRRTVTLQDVAADAGVAVSTASRALANPDRVSPATREHVQAVAARLGYRHHRAATVPDPGRMPMLALLVADITNPSNFGIIRGAEAQARAAGYTLVLGDTQENPAFEQAHAERLRSTVEGFVLAGSRQPQPELLELAGGGAPPRRSQSCSNWRGSGRSSC